MPSQGKIHPFCICMFFGQPAPVIAQDMFWSVHKSVDNAVLSADASFQREFLQAHNAYRALHGSPLLTLSSELTASAQKWADHLLALGLMNHSDTKDGENIFTKLSSDTLTGGLCSCICCSTST